jgi:hypothetical protein
MKFILYNVAVFISNAILGKSFAYPAATLPVSSSSSIAVDASWEFERGLEGWQSVSKDCVLSYLGDSVSMGIQGPSPTIQSPVFNLTVAPSTTIVLRYRYSGISSFGKFRLYGIHEKENVDLFFELLSGSQWHLAYASVLTDSQIQALDGVLTSLQLYPACETDEGTSSKKSMQPIAGQAFEIDWIRIVRGPPQVNKITGCSGNIFSTRENPPPNEVEYRSIKSLNLNKDEIPFNYTYATTYNCLRQGGETITVEGKYFGESGSQITIDGIKCRNVRHDISSPQTKITCTTPDITISGLPKNYRAYSFVEVQNGMFPGLIGTSNRLLFAYELLPPFNVTLLNTDSRSIDISWIPGGGAQEKSMCTGYIVRWKEDKLDNHYWTNAMVLGNITNTTIRGLKPGTKMIVGISALNEDQNDLVERYEADRYGRRNLSARYLEGGLSQISTTTLEHDFFFPFFNANLTRNRRENAIPKEAKGESYIINVEKHQGLSLTGDTSIANCNASSFCCDSFDEENGRCDNGSTHVCMAYHKPLNSSSNKYDFINSNRIMISELNHVHDETLFTAKCGPSLRLTSGVPRATGAAWYPKQMIVDEGFETNFVFELANPSYNCDHSNDFHKYCKSRGGSGFAFVIQNQSPSAIGGELGYDGIANSIAIEFDTFYDGKTSDPYENHVSVHTRGRQPNSANHTYSIGETHAVPDLTNGKIKIRIRYEPYVQEHLLLSPNYSATPYLQKFFQTNGISHTEDYGSWDSGGIGTLQVYVQNMNNPALIVLLQLAETLELNRGHAWVGFTSSSTDEVWQSHDILSWDFSSLRIDNEEQQSIFMVPKQTIRRLQRQ